MNGVRNGFSFILSMWIVFCSCIIYWKNKIITSLCFVMPPLSIYIKCACIYGCLVSVLSHWYVVINSTVFSHLSLSYKSWCKRSSSYVFQKYLGYWSFAFPYVLKISMSTIICFDFHWDCLDSNLGRIYIFTILSLSNHDHCIYFHLFNPVNTFQWSFMIFPAEDLYISHWTYC